MSVDALDKLRMALAASYQGQPARLAAELRKAGSEPLEVLFAGLSAESRESIDIEALRLLDEGVQAAVLGVAGYPPKLIHVRHAPPAIYFRGPQRHLITRGVGVCGSRDATPEGLRAAEACGAVGADLRLGVVSGYARGVDMAAHTAALDHGGSTVVVLAEGILNFKIRRGAFADAWDPSRVTVVSQFAPTQPWRASSAMTRNALISGLSDALVVVEARESGGTLAAGLHALERGQPVIALRLFGAPAGNRLLEDKGAIPVHSRQELASLLSDLPADGRMQLTLI